MRHIRIPFLVVVLSLMLTGMAFARDIPAITTWVGSPWVNYTDSGYTPGEQVPGLTITGVGGGGPGRGDVLLGPLYDVRDLTDPSLPGAAGTTSHHQSTMIAIVNTDPAYWMVGRLRFREAKRSVEVLDIDIPLSPRDVLVAEISRIATGGAVLNSPDNYIIPPFGDVYIGAGTGLNPFTMGPFPATGYPFIYAPQINDELTPAAAQARTEYGSLEFIGEERVCLILAPSPFAGKLARVGSGPMYVRVLVIRRTFLRTGMLVMY